MRFPCRRAAIPALAALALAMHSAAADPPAPSRVEGLPRVRVAPDGRTFQTADGKPFVPFGVSYYRPGTGWAPQVWKQFDADATRRDFARLKDLGANCVRVFLSYGSFHLEPGVPSDEGLAKFDRFLDLAEQAGLRVHPTGPDHWEGLPDWIKGRDRYADEDVLKAAESWWSRFAARYKGRGAIFAYDLLNEPEIGWDSPALNARWNQWLKERYGDSGKAAAAWGADAAAPAWGRDPAPPPEDKPRDPRLLDYQRFRESVADAWTRRQAAAIKAADPDALVTVGLIQWSIPALVPDIRHYAAFRPDRQAPFLDFLEIHFYPLEGGMYLYGGAEERDRNLAYLEALAREVARPGKPVVIAEFGWYGGGALPGHPAATEAQQAEWCEALVLTTAGHATGWLNWGFHDHPQAKDVSLLTGLLTVEGKEKAWGRRFRDLAARFRENPPAPAKTGPRPALDWDACVTDRKAGDAFREAYARAFRAEREGKSAETPNPDVR